MNDKEGVSKLTPSYYLLRWLLTTLFTYTRNFHPYTHSSHQSTGNPWQRSRNGRVWQLVGTYGAGRTGGALGSHAAVACVCPWNAFRLR